MIPFEAGDRAMRSRKPLMGEHQSAKRGGFKCADLIPPLRLKNRM
jgi:hypothetical protein